AERQVRGATVAARLDAVEGDQAPAPVTGDEEGQDGVGAGAVPDVGDVHARADALARARVPGGAQVVELEARVAEAVAEREPRVIRLAGLVVRERERARVPGPPDGQPATRAGLAEQRVADRAAALGPRQEG